MDVPKATPFSLPPGCRFFPSEEELFCYYIGGKNAESGGAGEGAKAEDFSDVIGELELDGYDPFDLPDSAGYSYGAGGRKRHWYCYTVNRALKAKSGQKRKAKSGFWRRKGRTKVVTGRRGGRGDLGRRTTFVFYLGNSTKTAVKTDWLLYEYAPIDHLKASFVLCRVFIKSRRRNTVSENGLVSCAEECVSAVRHVGIQHDGDETSCRNGDNEIGDQTMTEPAPIWNIEFPMYLDPDAQVDMAAFTALHLRAVIDKDYLECDDLVD